LEIAKFSPGPEGEVLAVGGRRGYVHIVDWKAGGGQVIGSIKMNSPIKDLCWIPSSGTNQRKQLMTLGQDAEVYVWDISSRKCLARWKDESNFGARIIVGSKNGAYYGVGYVVVPT
jgi:U3 small nucleolar RNA-associated protein 18